MGDSVDDKESELRMRSRWIMAFLCCIVSGTVLADKKTFKTTIPVDSMAVPLAKHPQGQAMMAEAVKRVALANMQFKFLDKTYENDVWAKDPFGNKYRLPCVRFAATSGFAFRVDQPTFQLSEQGLTIQQNIARMNANGLKFKFQLGPCMNSTAGFGIDVSNVNFVYKLKPMILVEHGLCKVTYDQDPEHLRVSIGNLDITGVQHDLAKLAKDAIREGINFTLDGAYSSLVRSELTKVTAEFCGK
jgi:hypothetical protein